MLILVRPARTAADEQLVGHARRAMQHERHRHSGPQAGHQLQVQHRVTHRSRMGRAHRHGEGIHPGRRDVAGRGIGVGARRGAVDAVLATHLAQLGLDPDAARVALPGHDACLLQVPVVVQLRRVVHHGRDAQVHRLPRPGPVDRAWSRWTATGIAGLPGDRQRRGREGRERPVVVDAVVADLEDDRRARPVTRRRRWPPRAPGPRC